MDTPLGKEYHLCFRDGGNKITVKSNHGHNKKVKNGGGRRVLESW